VASYGEVTLTMEAGPELTRPLHACPPLSSSIMTEVALRLRQTGTSWARQL